jgi:hypothetical protein
LEGNAEAGNDVIEEKMSNHFCCISEGGHGIFPFVKEFNNDYNIHVPITRWGVESHEINAPFTEGANGYDEIKKRRWCSGFVGV